MARLSKRQRAARKGARTRAANRYAEEQARGYFTRVLAARKGARTRAANRYAEEQARGYFTRVLKRQEARAVRERQAKRAEAIREEARFERETWEATTRYKLGEKRGVSVSMRIRRADGRPMTREEAEAAYRSILERGKRPEGVELDAVEWTKPSGFYQYTGEDMRPAFKVWRKIAAKGTLRVEPVT